MLSMSQLHVMLVHAADDVAQIIMETVEHLGHECDLVSDGAAVLKRVQQRQYDLIIMDAHPPGIADGLELVQQIRAIDSEVSPADLRRGSGRQPVVSHTRPRVGAVWGG